MPPKSHWASTECGFNFNAAPISRHRLGAIALLAPQDAEQV